MAALAAEGVATFLEGVRAEGPWQAAAYDGDASTARLTVSPARAGARDATGPPAYDVHLASDEAGLLGVLYVGESVVVREPAATWDELAARVEVLPEDVSLLVDAVSDGELAWDDEVVVTDVLRSAPSEGLYQEPDGTAVPVREAAGLMISISDNTATDALIDRLGPDRVLDAMADMGHAAPEDNDPLLTTRTLFQVAWGTDPELRERWRDGDAAERGAVLREAAPLPLDLTAQPDVAWVDGLDWFATPDDLVAAHVALQEKAATEAGAPARDVLAAEPALPDDVADEWDHVAFKGGNTAGTYAGSWYVERGDEAYVVVLQATSQDPAAFPVPDELLAHVHDALGLVGG